MDELYFLVMNIPEETKDLVYRTSSKVCDGMSESERQAYYLGIENTISALNSILNPDDGLITVNNPTIEEPEEFDVDGLTMMFCEEYE